MGTPLEPRAGYDKAAPNYLAWRWNLVWNEVEVPLVWEILKGLEQGLTLDAGCGLGRYRDPIRSLGHRYVGVDLSRRMLFENRRMRSKKSDCKEDLVEADLKHLPLVSGTFDSIVCLRVLTHVAPSELDCVFREFARVIRPGGTLIITDIDPEHRYTSTGIPAAGRKIQIRTYKHSPDLVSAVAATVGWTEQTIERLSAVNSTSSAGPALLDELGIEPEAPLFYLAAMRKADAGVSSNSKHPDQSL